MMNEQSRTHPDGEGRLLSGVKLLVVEDEALIAGKGRDQRPGLDAMMKAVNAKEFDMVASWSVDRLNEDPQHARLP